MRGNGFFQGFLIKDWDPDLGLSEYRSFPVWSVPGNSIKEEAMCLVCCFTMVMGFHMVELQFLANSFAWATIRIVHPAHKDRSS